MKIAFDAKRFFHNASGLGNYSRDLVRILAENFPENEYLLLDQKGSDRGAQIVAHRNVNFVKVPGGKFARQQKMGIIAQNLEADIFHGLSGELPLHWKKKPVKKIVTIHDLIFVRYPKYYSFFDRKIHFWKFKRAAKNADLIIAISEQTKQDIIDFLIIAPEKIEVVYQGCHQAFKEDFNGNLAQNLLEKHNLPERFILSVGTIESRKNLGNTVEALANTEIPLVVVGKKTSYFKTVEKKIFKNNLEKQIFFLDNINMQELAALYKMSDFLVYPSLFEGFGIPVIEALFSGTPVITSNMSSLPEAGGKGAVYVDPKNIKDLQSKILHLWNNKAERARIAEFGKQHVQKFSDEKIAVKMNDVYQKLQVD